MHNTLATRAAACVFAVALSVSGAAIVSGQEPMPTPDPYGDYSGITEPFEDLSAIAEVGALEPPPAEAQPPAAEVEPPAAEVPQPAPAAAEPPPPVQAPAEQAAPATTSMPSGLPATGTSSTATATLALQMSAVVLLVGASCVALSRTLRRA